MTMRDRPYAQFNFWVTLGEGSGPNQPDTGFQEINVLGIEVSVDDYRYGNHKLNHTLKGIGISTPVDVTLKRGVVGNKWFDNIRNGINELKTVRIGMSNEQNSGTVPTWVLNNARVIKFIPGPLNAKSNETAMEELTLTFERMIIE